MPGILLIEEFLQLSCGIVLPSYSVAVDIQAFWAAAVFRMLQPQNNSRSPTLRNMALLGLPPAGGLHTGQRRRLVRLHRLYPVRDGSLCGEAASCCVGLADLFVGWLPKWILKFQTAACFARPSCQRIRRIIAMSETRHV